jgi:signal transduction histidine kinase
MIWPRPGGLALDRGTTLFILLLVAMLLPAGVVLWFMNETVATQSAAARRSVLEAYRGQLRLVRSRVEGHWRTHATLISGTDDPERRFARLILDQTADGLVLLDADGSVAYPDRRATRSPRADAIAAEIQAASRLPIGEAREREVDAIAAALNDYTISMSGAERLASMERLRTLAPNVVLPTEAALRLSFALAGPGRPAPSPGHFQQTAVDDVWAFTSSDNRVVALYWTGRIEAMMHDLLHQVTPAGIRFIAFPPDVDGDPETIAAGLAMPGWQLTFQPLDRATLDDAARRQTTWYVVAAGGGIAAMAIVGLIVGGTFRRHLKLARLKTDLVAAVSHELRTPLASMRVLVDGLLADDELDPAKTKEYLGLLSAENSRLTRVIENFLTFSRLDRGRQQFSFAAAAPSAIVTAAIEAVRDRLPADASLRVDVEAGLPQIVADEDALVTALINLLDNAIKYTPADKRLEVQARRDGKDAVLFAVGDNGIGIPVREQRRIFRRFYRVDQRLTRETSGVGLGLSIVEQIVRAHGGTVAVRSESGVGSTFTVRVPAATAEAA